MSSTYAGKTKPAAHGVVNNVGETHLGAAMDELHRQHPHTQIAHTDDRGPYHSSDDFCRHIPVIRSNPKPYSR